MFGTQNFYLLYTCVFFSRYSVGKAIGLCGGPAASQFAIMFDKFFDVLNVTDFHSAIKPFRRPYCSADDDRLKVCIHVRILVFVVLPNIHQFYISG